MRYIIYFLPVFLSSIWAMDNISQIYSNYESGLITKDEFFLDQVNGLLSVNKDRKNDVSSVPDKCGTHILMTLAEQYPYLAESTKNRLKDFGFRFNGTIPILQRPDGLDLIYDSGIFRYHYSVTGSDAVDSTDIDNDGIPDYINSMADIFHSVVNTIIETYNFTPPPGDGWYSDNGGNELYDIYVLNLGSGFYGYVQPEYEIGDNENSGTKEINAFTSYMAIRNNFDGFQLPELENIQVTAGHEFFHAIQFGYDGWEAIWLLEATATWMEDEVFDDVNDNYQYLIPWFQDPKISLNSDSSPHLYGSWIFFRYLSEHMGGYNIIRKIFEKGLIHDSSSEDFSIQTIDEALSDIGTDFEHALVNMGIANVLLTSNMLANPYHYEEADDYRTFGIKPHYESTIILSDSSRKFLYEESNLKNNAAQYLGIISNKAPLKISFSPEDPSAQHYPYIVIQEMSGTVQIAGIDISTTIQIPQNSKFIAMAIITGVKDVNYNYILTLDPEVPLPKELSIIKNYPNPFPDITTIQFFTPVLQPITLTIYDVLGRDAGEIYLYDVVVGINEVKFEARYLPSGIYFLKLQGRDTNSVQKIILKK